MIPLNKHYGLSTNSNGVATVLFPLDQEPSHSIDKVKLVSQPTHYTWLQYKSTTQKSYSQDMAT